jgi:hypothetical protein
MRTSIIAVLLVAAFAPLAAATPLRNPAARSASQEVAQFETERDADLELSVAREIVALSDRRVLPRLEHWLRAADRHARGNAALIFAGLGDPRGLSATRARCRCCSRCSPTTASTTTLHGRLARSAATRR